MPASGPISEGQRMALMNRLCEVLGEEEGRTLMESLPAVHWHDLATKDDIRASEDRLRTEMHQGLCRVRQHPHRDRSRVPERAQRHGASVRQTDPHDGVRHAGLRSADLGFDPGLLTYATKCLLMKRVDYFIH